MIGRTGTAAAMSADTRAASAGRTPAPRAAIAASTRTGTTAARTTLAMTVSAANRPTDVQNRPRCTPCRRTVCQKPRLQRRICAE